MESGKRSPKNGNVKYVESYDFKHPKLFSKEIMRTLSSLHDVLARNLSRVYSSVLRRKVDVYLQKIDQLSTTEFLQGVETPSVIYLLNVEKLGGDLIMIMPPGLCIHMIERQSGGSGEDISERRMLTTIEEKIVSRVMKSINREIIVAWEPYIDFSIDSTTYESKPENIHLPTVDPTIVAKFIIDISKKEKVGFQICYSYSLLKEVMNNSFRKRGTTSRTEKLSEDELESYKRTLMKAGVMVQSLLGTTRLSINDIINLKEGDAIPLNQRADQPLEVHINNVKKMSAYPGVLQGRWAVKIYEMLDEINEQELV